MNFLDILRFGDPGGSQPVVTVLLSLLFHLDFITHYQDRGASAAHAIQMAVNAFADEWQERSGQIVELTQVFGLLPEDAKNNRWDALRGLLQSSGWQEVLRVHRLLASLPGLARIVRELGRTHHVVAMDVVEVAPAYDHADVIAASILARQ